MLNQAEKIKSDCAEDPALQEMVRAAPQANGMTVDELEKEVVDKRVKGFVYSVLETQARRAGVQEYHRENTPIPLGPYELGQARISPPAAAQAASRLKALGVLE